MTDPWANFWPNFIGSALVAVVSIVTILIANHHQTRLKRIDRSKEELELTASAIRHARTSVTSAKSALEALNDNSGLAMAYGNQATRLAMKQIDTMREARDEAAPLLVQISFTNPHEKIRIDAALLEAALGEADEKFGDAVTARLQQDKAKEANATLDAVKSKAQDFLTLVHEKYW